MTRLTFRLMIVLSGNDAGSPGIKKTPKSGLTKAKACPEGPTRCVNGLPATHVSTCVSEQPKAADQLSSLRTGVRGAATAVRRTRRPKPFGLCPVGCVHDVANPGTMGRGGRLHDARVRPPGRRTPQLDRATDSCAAEGPWQPPENMIGSFPKKLDIFQRRRLLALQGDDYTQLGPRRIT